MNRKNDLSFEMDETTFNTDKIICFLDRFAAQIVKKTVVVLDNSPIHGSNKVKAKIRQWEEDDLLIYFFTTVFPRVELD